MVDAQIRLAASSLGKGRARYPDPWLRRVPATVDELRYADTKYPVGRITDTTCLNRRATRNSTTGRPRPAMSPTQTAASIAIVAVCSRFEMGDELIQQPA
jgi:hypothetical protein